VFRMTDRSTGYVVVEFDSGATPITGILRHGHVAPRRFSGWVELLSALETTIAAIQLSSKPAEESAEQQLRSKEET
jgi:hypothetical protein